ncbi:general substrate transporter [Zopfia rhizophila CBS 207.26]|uniref:General substrate transporter n=1 Tax=Zopfia rhizophila CBS 207.26 TaxID=1314779 RepID=A0A6A6EF79_9PEZI|nr:general substrate transporter [Zopfia rhizophila CBS 207.26]
MTSLKGLSGNWLLTFVIIANVVLISSDFTHHFPETKNANISGITPSCFSLGAFVGAIFAFTTGDKTGRKMAILIGLVCNIVGAVLQIAAFHLPMMLIGRIINSPGMGIISSVCPVYQAECSSLGVRGKLVVVDSLCNTIASCTANWMNYGLYFDDARVPGNGWLGFPFIPESPRWLLLKDRSDDALVVVSRLLGRDLEVNDHAVLAEFLSIQTSLREERAKSERTNWNDMITFKDRTQNFRRMLLSCGTHLIQQFSGNVGFSNQTSCLLSGINAIIYVIAAFSCLLLIDWFGRRKMMLYGALTCGSWYLVAAMTIRQGEIEPDKQFQFGAATTAIFVLYYFCYGTSFAKICAFYVTQFTKVGVNNLHWHFYLIFSIFCSRYFPIVFCLYLEMSQRSLEDMDCIFSSHPSVLVAGKLDLTQRKRPQAFIDARKHEESRQERRWKMFHRSPKGLQLRVASHV